MTEDYTTRDFSIRFDKDRTMRDDLREPFPPEQVGRIPASKGRPALDYVGHAAVTDRLNTFAPGWTYTVDAMFDRGNEVWLRGTMTVGQISRVEYGDGKDPKEAIGNFIRRGAMRFGVAIDLWSREELSQRAVETTGALGGRTPHSAEERAATPEPSDASPQEPASAAPIPAGTKSDASVTLPAGKGGGDSDGEAGTPPPSINSPADPAQWDKALQLMGSKVAVIKAAQAKGYEVRKAADISAGEMADVIASFGKGSR